MEHQWALDIPEVLATSDGTKSLYGLERLAVLEGGAWHYPQHDALGSVRQWTDAAAAVLATQSYSPFGVPRATLAVAPWGFTGEWHNAGGLVYLRARWYNPTLGRFTQADPSDLEANPYLYARANPVSYTDPTGHFTDKALKAYLRNEYGDDWEYYWQCWLLDPEWIDLLHGTVAGDILFRTWKEPVEPMLQFYRFEGQGHELLESITEIRKPAADAQPLHPGWPPPNVDIVYRGSKGVGVMHFTGADVELIGTVGDIYCSEYVVSLTWVRIKKVACGVASEIILGAVFQLAPLRSVPEFIQRALQVGIPAVGDYFDPEFSKLPGMTEGDKMVDISAHPAAGPERVMRAHGVYWYRGGKLISGGQVLFDTALFGWTE